jgi:hypothetical protein
MTKHYIVTRFNLGLYRTNGRVPEEWFPERLGIFERVTLASLARQTSKDFTLLVLIDSETPKKHHTRLCNILMHPSASGFNKIITPINLPKSWNPKRYGERWSSYIDYMPALGLINLESESTTIQTRLDNDDALTPDAVETMRMHAQPSPRGYILDYTNGYIFDSVKQRAYYATHPKGTPFVSLVQPTSSKMKSVYTYTHHDLINRYHCQERRDRLWIMHLHGKNVSNRLYPWMVEKEISLQTFTKETKVS